jgi:hypothetical protein
VSIRPAGGFASGQSGETYRVSTTANSNAGGDTGAGTGTDSSGGGSVVVDATAGAAANVLGLFASPYRFRASDTVPPTLLRVVPSPNATSVALDTPIVLRFNEFVTAVEGEVVRLFRIDAQPSLDAGGLAIGDYSFAVEQLAASRSNGTTVVRFPPVAVASDAQYRLAVPAGSFVDLAGLPFGGRSVEFETADTQPPVLVSAVHTTAGIARVDPPVADDGPATVGILDYLKDTVLVLEFDEPVRAGSVDLILTSILADGTSTIDYIPTTDKTAVQFGPGGYTMSVTAARHYLPGRVDHATYTLSVPRGAVVDRAATANLFAGAPVAAVYRVVNPFFRAAVSTTSTTAGSVTALEVTFVTRVPITLDDAVEVTLPTSDTFGVAYPNGLGFSGPSSPAVGSVTVDGARSSAAVSAVSPDGTVVFKSLFAAAPAGSVVTFVTALTAGVTLPAVVGVTGTYAVTLVRQLESTAVRSQTAVAGTAVASAFPPVFELAAYRVSVAEDYGGPNTDPSTGDGGGAAIFVPRVMVTVNAPDVDELADSPTTYRLANASGRASVAAAAAAGLTLDPDALIASLFAVDSDTGAVTTVRALDRESTAHGPVYTFGVQATEGAPPYATAVAMVVVTLTDVNDNAPVFLLSAAAQVRSLAYLEAVVHEGESAAGDVVVAVAATDADQGDNAALTYSLGPSAATEMFAIDPTTGVVTVRQVLARSVQQHVVLVATVTDSAGTAVPNEERFTAVQLIAVDTLSDEVMTVAIVTDSSGGADAFDSEAYSQLLTAILCDDDTVFVGTAAVADGGPCLVEAFVYSSTRVQPAATRRHRAARATDDESQFRVAFYVRNSGRDRFVPEAAVFAEPARVIAALRSESAKAAFATGGNGGVAFATAGFELKSDAPAPTPAKDSTATLSVFVVAIVAVAAVFALGCVVFFVCYIGRDRTAKKPAVGGGANPSGLWSSQPHPSFPPVPFSSRKFQTPDKYLDPFPNPFPQHHYPILSPRGSQVRGSPQPLPSPQSLQSPRPSERKQREHANQVLYSEDAEYFGRSFSNPTFASMRGAGPSFAVGSNNVNSPVSPWLEPPAADFSYLAVGDDWTGAEAGLMNHHASAAVHRSGNNDWSNYSHDGRGGNGNRRDDAPSWLASAQQQRQSWHPRETNWAHSEQELQQAHMRHHQQGAMTEHFDDARGDPQWNVVESALRDQAQVEGRRPGEDDRGQRRQGGGAPTPRQRPPRGKPPPPFARTTSVLRPTATDGDGYIEHIGEIEEDGWATNGNGPQPEVWTTINTDRSNGNRNTGNGN